MPRKPSGSSSSDATTTEHQSAWSKFESELTKRTAELRERFKDDLRLAVSEKENLSRRVEDSLREIGEVREKNQLLEAELAKVAGSANERK